MWGSHRSSATSRPARAAVARFTRRTGTAADAALRFGWSPEPVGSAEMRRHRHPGTSAPPVTSTAGGGAGGERPAAPRRRGREVNEPIALSIPDELVEAIADRAAGLVVERLSHKSSPWLTRAQ